MSSLIDLDNFCPQTQEELDIAKTVLKDELYKRGLSGIPSKDKIWKKYYSPELLNVSAPQMRMADYLYEKNKKRLDLYAINYMGKRITYAEMFEKIDDTAKRFQKYGVKEDDYVCLALPVSPETIYMVYALEKIGACASLIDPRVNAERMEYYLNLTKSCLVGITGIYASTMRNALINQNETTMLNISPLQSFEKGENTLLRFAYKAKMLNEEINEIIFNLKQAKNKNRIIDSKQFYRENLSDYSLILPAYKQNQTGVVEFTSGTTGVPKGLELSSASINLVVEQLETLANSQAGQTVLGIMPPFISYGMVCGTHSALACGTESILIPNFRPEIFPELILKHKPNIIFCVPSFLQLLQKSYRVNSETDLSFIKKIIVGGDKTDPRFEKQFNKWLEQHKCNITINIGGGMAEFASVLFYCPYENTKKPGAYGLPMPAVDAKIVDENGNELGYYEIGEIHISSEQHMKGYINDEKATQDFFYVGDDGKKYGRSGDLGYVDINGFFYLLNRKKQMIIRPDGHNVFPSEIRSVINECPYVSDSLVVGIKDDKVASGLWPTAFIKLKPGCDNMQKALKEIRKLCERKLPPRDRPREQDYFLVKKICITTEGKVDEKMTVDSANYL